MSRMSYPRLDALLEAQHPISDAHDETRFIIPHQTAELWRKLMLHALRAARASVARDELSPAFKRLARVSRVFALQVHAWNVLATLVRRGFDLPAAHVERDWREPYTRSDLRGRCCRHDL